MSGNSPRVTNLNLLFNNLNDVIILDFGGGSGWLFWTIPENLDFTYLLVEKSAFIRAISSRYVFPEQIKFISAEGIDGAIPKELFFSKGKKILYFNSVFQYLDSSIFEFIYKFKPDFICIEDLVTSNSVEYKLVQKYYTSSAPYLIWSENDLLEEMSELGFHLDCYFNYGSNEYGLALLEDIKNCLNVDDGVINLPKTYIFSAQLFN